MNEIATRKLSPVEVFVGEVLNPERKRDVLRALPRGINPDRFEQSLSIAVMQNPALLKVHPGLVFREVVKASSLGLFMDPQLGEAYIVIVRNNRAGRDEPQLRIGYRGLDEAGPADRRDRQHLRALVYARDHFRIAYGLEFTLIHEPWLQPLDSDETDPGPIRGVLCRRQIQKRRLRFRIHAVARGREDPRPLGRLARLQGGPDQVDAVVGMAERDGAQDRDPPAHEADADEPDLLTAMQMIDREEEEPDEVDTVSVKQRRPKTDEALRQIANGIEREDEQPARKRRGRPARVEVPETDEIERATRRRRAHRLTKPNPTT